MITVLHKGWSDKWLRYIMNLWLLHEEYHFHRLQIFSVGKNLFWRVCQNDKSITLEGYGEMITVLHGGGGVWPNDYNITQGGVPRDPQK